MEKRLTKSSSGPRKRQVRLLQQRLESEGLPKSEAHSRALQKGSEARRKGLRAISRKEENAALAQRPKRKRGIKIEGGRIKLPRRITSKRAEAITSGHALSKRSDKSRK